MRKRDKRDPKELWDELVQEAGEDEIEKAAGMSVAQAEAELRAAGVDVGAERARARALLAELAGQKASGPAAPAPRAAPESRGSDDARGPEPEGRGRKGAMTNVRPFRRWMAAAGVVAAAAGAALVLAKIKGDSGDVTHPAPSDEDLAKAADLRRRAAAALTEGRAEECLSRLDEARAKDPVGDSAPDVKKLREDALRALGRTRTPPR